MHHQLLHIHKTPRQMVSEGKMHIPEHIHSQIGSRSLSRDLPLFLAVGKQQQRLLMFYNASVYVTVSLSQSPPPLCLRESVGGAL